MTVSAALMVLAYLAVVVAFAYTQPEVGRRRLALKTGLGVLTVFGMLAYFRGLLVPFLLPLLIAYLMDPVLDWFEAKGWPRVGGIVLVYLFVMAFGLAILLVLVPPVVNQIADLAKALASVDWKQVVEPDNIKNNAGWLIQHLPGGLDATYKVRLMDNMRMLVDQWQDQLTQVMPYVSEAARWLGTQAGNLAAWAFSTVSGLMWLLLLPITLWYWLADFDKLRRRLWYMVPAERRPMVGRLATASNKAIGGYIRGYAVLSVMVGVVQTTLLLILQSMFGFKYGLVIGVFAGCTYFIPYVGSLSSVFLGTLAIYLTGGYDFGHTFIGFVILQASNSLFDNVINPKIIGESTGLHPMLIMFALLAGGKLLGLAGVVLATPVLLCAKIVLEFYFPRLAEPIPDEENPDLVYPFAPAEPSLRAEPAEPVLPVSPVAPVAPAEPALRAEPDEPVLPVGAEHPLPDAPAETTETESGREDTDNP